MNLVNFLFLYTISLINKQNPKDGKYKNLSAIKSPIGIIFETGKRKTKNHKIENAVIGRDLIFLYPIVNKVTNIIKLTKTFNSNNVEAFNFTV